MTTKNLLCPIISLSALLIIGVGAAVAAEFDADAYNDSQTKKLSIGDRTVIAVGRTQGKGGMQETAEALIRIGSGHTKAIAFEYRRTNILLPPPLWWFWSDDDMDARATEQAGARLAVFIAQVKHKTGRSPDAFGYSQGATVLAKAARWIARIREASGRGEDVSQRLKTFTEWERLTPVERKLLIDNLPLLKQASLGTVVVAGSLTHALDSAYNYLNQVVDKRTPSGQPASFYVYSDGDFLVNALLGRGLLVIGPLALSKEQEVFIRGIGHDDYLKEWRLGLGLIAELFKEQRLSTETQRLLEEHNRSGNYSDDYFGWVLCKPRGVNEYVPVRKVRPGLLLGLPGEPIGALAKEVITRAIREKQPGKRPHVLLYGDQPTVDAVAGWLTKRGVTVTKRYGFVGQDAVEVAASFALESNADVAVVLSSCETPSNGNDFWSPDDLPLESPPAVDPRFLPQPLPAPGGVAPKPLPASGGVVPTYTLSEAIQKGLIECIGAVTADDNGGIRGILRLRKRTDDTFRVYIPSGTLLKSDDPHSQNLVIW